MNQEIREIKAAGILNEIEKDAHRQQLKGAVAGVVVYAWDLAAEAMEDREVRKYIGLILISGAIGFLGSLARRFSRVR